MIVDLSHPIEAGMTTYPGLPGPVLSTHTSRADSAARMDGVSFDIGRIDLVANTGTYVDSPFHFHSTGADLAALPLDRLVDVPAVVVRSEGPAIGPTELGDPSRLRGVAVLVHTGWSRHWRGSAYGEGSPYLTRSAASLLVEAGIAVLGVDCLNVDDITDLSRPVHDTLLGAGIPLVEHLTNLDQVPDTGARLTALPAPVVGLGTFPVRAVAVF